MDERCSQLEEHIGVILNQVINRRPELDYVQHTLDQIGPPDIDLLVVKFKAQHKQRVLRRVATVAILAVATAVIWTPFILHFIRPEESDADKAKMRSVYEDGIQHGFLEVRPNGIPAMESDGNYIAYDFGTDADGIAAAMRVFDGLKIPDVPSYTLSAISGSVYDTGIWRVTLTYSANGMADIVKDLKGESGL